MAQVLINPSDLWDWHRVGSEASLDPLKIPDFFLLDRFWDRVEVSDWIATHLAKPVVISREGQWWAFQTYAYEDRTALEAFLDDHPLLPHLRFRLGFRMTADERRERDALRADLNGGLVKDVRCLTIPSEDVLKVVFRRAEDAALVKLRWSHLLAASKDGDRPSSEASLFQGYP